MESIGIEILKSYGFFAFLVVALIAYYGYMSNKMLQHFMDEVRNKETSYRADIVTITSQFTGCIDANTQAMNDLCKAELHIANESKNLNDGFDRLSEQTRDEHNRILTYIQNNV